MSPQIALHLLDTNIIVRVIVGSEPPEAATAARWLFQKAAKGELTLLVVPLVLAETIFVLTSYYQLSRTDIASVLSDILRLPGVNVSELATVHRALALFTEQSKLHFVDCYLIARAEIEATGVATLDAGIGGMGIVPVLNPMQETRPDK